MRFKPLAAACAIVFAGLAAPAPAAAAPPKCVTVYDFPDAGLVYCYDLQGECTLSETRTTFIGTETRCVIERPVETAAGEDASVVRCVGNGALNVKLCVDTEGSCLLASYSSGPAGPIYTCYVRNP